MIYVVFKIGKNVTRVFRHGRAVALHHPKALFLAGVIIGSFFGYTLSVLLTEATYRLSEGSVQLIGKVNPTLSNKLKLDKNIAAYRFNPESITPEMTSENDPSKVAALLASQKQQTGGGSNDSKNLYSLDLPIDPSEGTKVYDVNSKTSFKLIPQFGMAAGRPENGRVVYPIDEGGQAIYTVKANGIKEDIVLQKPRGDELSFEYKLELPKTLEARLDDRGNLGVYSVDPTVISAIAGALQSSVSSTDTERLKDVQENGTKNHLVYMIPAPTIMQSGGQPKGHMAKAIYKLNGDQLTVETTGLERLIYPITIDPTVVVTSTSDFTTGNNEGDIQFDTDAISRTAPTGGAIGSWASSTAFTAARYDYASVTYNGYVYMAGGRDASAILSDVQYAPLNADGTIGNWTTTTSLLGGVYRHAMAAYNGYLYVLGGATSLGGGSSDQVMYAPISASGTVGGWTTTSGFTSGVGDLASVAYNGYLYVIGGSYFNGSTTSVNTVRYASFNADGTVGGWTTTSGFTTACHSHTSIVYNGYLYVIGGRNNSSSSPLSTVQYAPLNTDGSVGAWVTATALTIARDEHASIAYGGYLYVIGGRSGTSTPISDVQYAPINADGSLGAWQSTTSLSAGRYSHTAVAYKGKMYVMGGYDGTNLYNATQYVGINNVPDSVAGIGSWATTTALGAGGGSPAARVTTRANHGSAVYNGYMYLVAGTGANTTIANVHYAPLNANGTVGAWLTTTSLTAARAGLATIAVNGYLYAIGGQDTNAAFMTTAYYAPINANGTIGNWATTTPLASGRSNAGLVNYNGYIYSTGGIVTGGAPSANVEYAVINANGTLGSWTSTTPLSAARGAHASAIYNGIIYVIGGVVGTVTVATTSYAPINANGTVGAWNSTMDLPLARSYINARIYQGYVFVVGGYQGGGVESNTTYYAKMNADGSLGSWSTGSSIVAPSRDSHGVEIYNGYIYLTGGWNGSTPYGDVQYAPLTYGPPVSTTGTLGLWQATAAANIATYGQSSVVYGNFIYLIGGLNGTTYLNNVQYAPFNADGTIGAWTTSANTMNVARFNGAAAAYNGYLYVTGGQQGTSAFTNTTEYAPINADGTIGAWTTSASVFTTARAGHITAAYNGKLYVACGGDSANAALNDVKYATINADGTVGAWADTQPAAQSVRDADGFIYGGRFYIVGGLTGSTYLGSVLSSPINSNGTLAGFGASANQFTTGRSRLAAVAVNGYVYISGGGTTSFMGDLQYAPIDSTGSIGTWQSSNSLSATSGAPAAYYHHSMVAYKGKLYSLGGADAAGTAQTASYVTTQKAPALRAVYSKLIDLGQSSTFNSIAMNGVLPPDQNNVLFKVAGSDGLFGSWQSPSVLNGAPIANTRYVMYKISLDDSSNSSLSSTGGRSSVADVTLDYTLQAVLTPDIRLRQNKYFDGSGMLQPLQTQ